MGPDGVIRPRKDHEQIAADYALTFMSPTGARVLAHLRSITVNHVNGPEITDAALRHHEGMRNLNAIIEQWVKHGRNGPQQPAPEPDRTRRKRGRGAAAGG